ncbi:hypothetical protein VaNZ11_013802 [Volvox africanus]|uniref:Phosphatidic acid phosphatase type 2/haloperoxidase domain-containing protein n=1 Tax=Volvox africanus TaxID=51714 RepID=A0ABQ5SI07_9CHLO|nr:hypothetical protein VaNZ11_013802 [Volvox africanus]
MAFQRSVVITILIAAAAVTPGNAAINSIISQWLTIAQNTVLTLGFEHQQAARVYGIVASAQYDVILLARVNKAAYIPDEVAAAYASHAALSNLFNWRQNAIYDVALLQNLAQFNVSDSLLPVLQSLAIPAVQKILYDRLRDGSSLFANFKPFSNSSENIGRYQFTPGQTSARYPQVGQARPFFLTSGEVDLLTRPLKHFSLDDPEYARQLKQVYLYGSANSTVRSAYDSDSARFWALGPGTGSVAGIWINISIAAIPSSTPVVHQARFFKILTTSFWDAAVACWRTKYRELFWRPITAIRTFHGIIPADPSWTPLLPTPAHPEYPSGHQCSSGAAVYVLESFLGVSFPFDVASPSTPLLGPRSYPSFRAAGIEVGNSRLYAGVHFNKSNVDGFDLGYRVARYVHLKNFKSATFSSSI